MEPATKTPLLHHKLEQMLPAEDLIPGSHDYKAVVALFESFPKDELFQASAEELRHLVAGLLQLEKHGGIRVLIRRDLYGRNVSVVVALPRDRFNAELRKRLQAAVPRAVPRHDDRLPPLARRDGVREDLLHGARRPGMQIPDVPLRGARARGRAPRADVGRRPARRARRRGSGRARARARREVRAAVPRLLQGERRMGARSSTTCCSSRSWSASARGSSSGLGNEAKGERLTRVKLYKTGGKVDLSAFMPILEALGLRVVEEVPTALARRGQGLHPRLRRAGRAGAPCSSSESAADRVTRNDRGGLARRGESDSLNRLVDRSRASRGGRYDPPGATGSTAMRVSAQFTEEYRNDAMRGEPADLAARLVRLFEAKFDPVRAAIGGGDRRDPPRDPPGPARSWPRSTRTGSSASSSARSTPPSARTPTCPTAVPELQAPSARRAGHAQAVPAVRDLRVLAADGGDPPARRDGRARRDPLVGPQGGLPHRGARPDEGPEGEERRHRPRRIEGRLRPEADAGRRPSESRPRSSSST